MGVLYLIEGLLFALLAIFLVTQVIIPAVLNAPLFPGMRFRSHLRRLDEARAEREASRLDADIARERIHDINEAPKS